MKQYLKMNLLVPFSHLTTQHIKIYLLSKFEMIDLGQTQNGFLYQPGGSTSTLPLTCRLPQATNVENRSRQQLFYLIALVRIRTRDLWP